MEKGEFRIIKGNVIEKGVIAFSNVTGTFQKNFKTNTGTEKNKKFWSTGVSVVLHPANQRFLHCSILGT